MTTMLDWFYCAQSPEHADASPEAAEYLRHELIVRLLARPPSRLPCLVLGDGSVDLGFLDLLGVCAVPQGLERVLLVHRNHDRHQVALPSRRRASGRQWPGRTSAIMHHEDSVQVLVHFQL